MRLPSCSVTDFRNSHGSSAGKRSIVRSELGVNAGQLLDPSPTGWGQRRPIKLILEAADVIACSNDMAGPWLQRTVLDSEHFPSRVAIDRRGFRAVAKLAVYRLPPIAAGAASPMREIGAVKVLFPAHGLSRVSERFPLE
jgi:hypothetical protein